MRGGLYIPDTAKEKPTQGEVVAVGPGRIEKGERIKMELSAGDRVIYGKYSGTPFNLEDGTGSEPDECVKVYEVEERRGEIVLRLGGESAVS